MAYFAMFVDLKSKKALVVGGGTVALHKAKSLNEFGANITIVAKQLSEAMREAAKENGWYIYEKPFEQSDLAGSDLVVAAVDDLGVQSLIYDLCVEQKIPVNCVDVPQFCTFTFGSMRTRGDIVVAVSTSAKAPGLSKALADRLEGCIPDGIELLLSKIEKVRAEKPKGKQRQEELLLLCEEFFGMSQEA